MDIRVGDKVTYGRTDTGITELIITSDEILEWLKIKLNHGIFKYKVLNVERPCYKAVKTVKEVEQILTEDERDFLKDMCKYYDVNEIIFEADDICFYRDREILNCPDYPNNLKFQNIKKYRVYTLQELGLEE